MWREIFGRNITHVDIDAIGDEPFHASVTFQSLPGVGLVSGMRSAAQYRITRQHLAQARDGFGLTMLMSGAATTEQFDREIILQPGSAVVISPADPSVSTMCKPGSVVTIALPRPTERLPKEDAFRSQRRAELRIESQRKSAIACKPSNRRPWYPL